MKPTTIVILSAILLTSACAAPPPEPTPTSKPMPTETPNPSPTPGLSGTVLPELVLAITNESSPLKDPYGVAISPSGKVYVNDAGNSRVLAFDSAGTLLETWDQKGTGDGQFTSLGFGGIASDSSGNVFVVDNGNHRIQKFDAAGT